MEMRLAVASLVRELEFSLSDQWDERKFWEGTQDRFTMTRGELWLNATPRLTARTGQKL